MICSCNSFDEDVRCAWWARKLIAGWWGGPICLFQSFYSFKTNLSAPYCVSGWGMYISFFISFFNFLLSLWYISWFFYLFTFLFLFFYSNSFVFNLLCFIFVIVFFIFEFAHFLNFFIFQLSFNLYVLYFSILLFFIPQWNWLNN